MSGGGTPILRYPTLPAKYNALVGLVDSARATPEQWETEILVVWEDDDIYLPWHLSTIVGSLYAPVAPRYKHGRAWVHPSRVWSLHGGHLHQEPAGGRFHAALAMRVEALQHIGGWPDTPRADFDQQLMARLRRQWGPPADPCEAAPPSYVFRWASTNSYHGQAWMRSPADTAWYRNAPSRIPSQGAAIRITLALDVETEALICGPQPIASWPTCLPLSLNTSRKSAGNASGLGKLEPEPTAIAGVAIEELGRWRSPVCGSV